MCIYVQLSPAVLGSPKRETPASHIGIIQIHTSGTEGCEVEVELQIVWMVVLSMYISSLH